MPKISVIMPAYNAGKYIGEAIESILNQTYGDFEFIILNDCSKDETEEIILSYDDERIVYVKNEENLGVARTLNKGLAMAKGEYIARMDADDIAVRSRFAKQKVYLDAHPDCAVCGSWVTVFGEGIADRTAPFSQKDADIRADLLFGSAFVHPSVMLRRSLMKKTGGYDCDYEKAEDYEFWYRLLAHGKGHNLPEVLLRYRHHGGQVALTHQKVQKEAVARLHKRMLREMNAGLTEEETAVFLRLCAGERCFAGADYNAFIFGGRKLITAAKGYAGAVRKVYSCLNLAVMKAAGIKKGARFGWREPVYGIYNKLRGR